MLQRFVNTPMNASRNISENDCPFLGLKEDSETYFGFPTPANYCYQLKKPDAINPAYQERVCLTPNHRSCPVYNKEWKGRLPAGIRHNRKIIRWQPYYWTVLLTATFLMFIAWFVVNFPEEWLATKTEKPVSAYALIQSPTATPTFTPTATPSPIPTSTQASRSTPSATATQQVTATQTPGTMATSTPDLPTPGPDFMTPFGADGTYLLHQVAYGDSLPKLAKKYNTHRDVITKINGLVLNESLQPNQVIVIMPGTKDPAETERLTIIQLDHETPIKEIAYQYSVTVGELRTYNDLGPGETIPEGRWLIFPHRNVTPIPLPTAIPTPDLSAALTPPFGPDNKFVLHKVEANQSATLIADIYLSSAELIRAINITRGSLRVGDILVVVIEETDPAGLPVFEVSQVKEAITVEDLAEQLNVPLDDLLYYNGFLAGQTLPVGQWVIYPVAE